MGEQDHIDLERKDPPSLGVKYHLSLGVEDLSGLC